MTESTRALWVANGEEESKDCTGSESGPRARWNGMSGVLRKNAYLLGVPIAVLVTCTLLGLAAGFLKKGHISQPNQYLQDSGGLEDSADTRDLTELEIPVQPIAAGKFGVATVMSVSSNSSLFTRPATPRHSRKLTARKARLLNESQDEGEEPPRSCTTEQCHKQSDYLKKTINFAADPCYDFYDYVCGNYWVHRDGPYAEIEETIRNATISALSTARVPAFNQNAFQKAAALYQACFKFVNADLNEAVASILPYIPRRVECAQREQLKSLMVSLNLDLLNLAASRNVDPVSIVARLSFEVGFPAFFEFKLSDDYFREGKRAMEFKVTDYQKAWEKKRDKLLQRGATGVLTYISDQLLYYPDYDPDQETHKELAKTVTTYDEEFSTVYRIDRYLDDSFDIRPIEIMAKHTHPKITAVQWISAVSTYTNGTYAGLDAIEYRLGLLLALARLMNSSTWGPDGFRALLAWGLFDSLLDYALPQKAVFGQAKEVACYHHVLGVMEYAANSRYLRSVVTWHARRRATIMFESAREVFRTQVVHDQYLQGTEKFVLLKILNLMKAHICSPEERLDETFVNEHFGDFPDMSATGRFLDAWFKALSGRARQKWRDQIHTFFNTSRAAPYYSKLSNSIIIPAGALLPNLLYADGHPALTVGTLGDALSHEIMKAFDVRGPDQCYSEETTRNYNSAVLCLQESHERAGHPLPAGGSRFVGLQSVADMVAINTVRDMFWTLYRDERSLRLPDVNLTGEQLAFVGRCMTKCKFDDITPTGYLAGPRLRCNVPAKNYKMFGDAFSCHWSTLMREPRPCGFKF